MASSGQQAKQIFLKLADRVPAEDWDACLDDECSGDVALKGRVQALLEAHANPQSRLGGPLDITRPEENESQSSAVGQQIGPYKLLEVIGEGGMGTVYMARQTDPVNRKVALKLIKTGMDTRQVVARFEAERQSLAMMDHPNIAKVLDAGATESGSPYFVMELVKGKPITKFCDEQQLDTHARLKLFQQVCKAVQHAHQKGIIHRDIKPSNVLVAMYDDKPVPKVIDFGVAKATGEEMTEKTMFTRFGQIIGTLEYMSPEQAQFNNLDIDTRSDIYSLGAILYELLVGEPPFDRGRIKSQALDETLRMIREDEPTKPSTKLGTAAKTAQVAANRKTSLEKLGSIVRGDLDWIVMKALEKDRKRRYETANQLQLDVERYLNNEPVSATPPTAAYRFRKFAGRNKFGMAFATLTAIFLVAGVIGLVWSNYWLTLSGNETLAALNKADENLQLAQANERRALREAAIAEAVNEFINVDLLGKSDPFEKSNSELTVREVLENTLRSIEGRFSDQPLVEAEIRTTIGKSLKNLARYDEARKQLLIAQEIFSRNLGPNDRKIIDIESELLWIDCDLGRYQSSEDRCVELLALTQQHFGPEDRLTLFIGYQLADIKSRRGQYRNAEQLLKEVLIAQERLLGKGHQETLDTMYALGQTMARQRRYADAEILLNEILELYNSLYSPEHPSVTACRNLLADVIMSQGRYEEAEVILREILTAKIRVLGPNHLRTFVTKDFLALTIARQGRYAESEKLFKEFCAEMERSLGPLHPHTLTCLSHLGGILHEQGRHDEALKIQVDIFDSQKRQFGPNHPDTLLQMQNLGEAYRAVGESDKALPLLEESMKLHQSYLGLDNPAALSNMNNLALAYSDAGQLDQAILLFEKTLKLSKANLGRDHPDTLQYMSNLAGVYLKTDQLNNALVLLEESYESSEANLGADDPRTLHAMQQLAVSYWQTNKLEKAIPLFEKAITYLEPRLGRNHPNVLKAIANLGVNYRDAGRLAEAIPLLEEVHQAATTQNGLWWVSGQLIATYIKAAKTDQAKVLVDDYLQACRAGLPGDSRELAKQLVGLSRDYFLEVEDYNHAERLLRESLAIYQQQIPDSWRTFNTRFLLGQSLLGQKKFIEAEPLLLAGYQGLVEQEKLIQPIAQRSITKSLQRLVELYEFLHAVEPDAGYDTKAANWHQKLEEHNARFKRSNQMTIPSPSR